MEGCEKASGSIWFIRKQPLLSLLDEHMELFLFLISSILPAISLSFIL